MTTDATLREETDPHCITDAQAVELLGDSPWRRFVTLGDSVAEGVGEAKEGYRTSPWADRVAESLRRVRPDLAYLNLGRRDLFIAEVRAQQLEQALDFKSDLTAVVCGGNDMLHKSFDPDAVETELSRIIAPLRDAGSDVVTMGLFDITQSRYVPEPYKAGLKARLHQLSERTQDVSLRHGAIYVDLSNHPAGAEDDIYSTDGRHVNMRGHAVAAAAVIRRLGAHLNGTL
jgi:lysophospholipase L1-like esterase